MMDPASKRPIEVGLVVVVGVFRNYGGGASIGHRLTRVMPD
jgi:hypothetical protein